MKIKTIVIISILSVALTKIAGENPCNIMMPRGGDGDWGIGAFVIPHEFELDLYQSNEFFGTLKTFDSYLRIINTQKKGVNLTQNDIDYLGHYSFEILKVKSIDSNNMALILWKNVNGCIKVCKSDIESKGAKFFTYEELLLLDHELIRDLQFKEWSNIGVNLEENCLNLRELPTIESTKIKCVLGNDWGPGHTHMKILESKGNWAKVSVTNYEYNEELDESGEGCTFDEIETLIGWVKAIDESGFPNIWYSVTSY